MGSNYQDVVLAFDKVVDKKEAWLSTEIPGIQDYQAAVMACVGKPHGEFANKLVEIAGKEATSLEAAEKILTLVDSVLGENSPQAFRVKLAIAEKNFEVKKKQPDAEAQAQAYLDLLTEAMTRYNTLVCDAEHGSGADVLMAPEVTQAAYHVVIRSLNAEKYADLMDHLDDLIEKHKTHGQLQQAASDMTLANQPQEATIAPYSYYLFLGGIYEALRTGKVNV